MIVRYLDCLGALARERHFARAAVVCAADERHRGSCHLRGHRRCGVTLDGAATLGFGAGRRPFHSLS